MNRTLLFCLLLCLTVIAHSHNTGSIKGHISNLRTGGPIPSANVSLKETIIGTTADINGNFEIKNVSIGTYVVSCSGLGFKTKSVSVEVKENVTTSVDFQMEESMKELQEVTVEGIRPISAASSAQIRKIDMQLRPFRTSQDMLMMVPGLVIAQHAGGGKAEQIFLRGFDCDHGTDVSVNVDGIPVNMVSHSHGQGYADLHFLIAETVDDLEVNKGPYFAKFGDFATAGAVSFKTKDILDHNLVKVEAGGFNTQKYTLMYQIDNGGVEQNGYVAAQYYHTDGPFLDLQKLQRMNVFGKYFIQLTQNSKLTFSLGGYNSGWNASGQIPTRAVKNGFIDRFEALDPFEGGITDRENLSIQYTFKSHTGSELQLQSYLSNYNFKLFSNFTYFLNDSINGDMIEQCERRTIHGMNAVYKFTSKLNSINVVNRLGSSYRSDNITPQLWHSPDRNRLSVYTNDQIMQQNFTVWGEQDLFLSPALRLTWGIRHDLFTFSKNDLAEDIFDPNSNGLPHASGYAWNSVFSPKINLTVNPMRNLDIYLNFGQGFHSNDARDVVTGEKVNELSAKWKREGLSATQINDNLLKYHFNPLQRNTGSLPKATGGEIGVRTIMTDKLHVGIAGWYLYLEKEFIYAGDGGTTELSNSTTRIGFDAESRYTLTPWLWLDADLSLSKGTVSDLPSGKNYIPQAPRLTASAGVNIMRGKGLNGSLRIRHIGDRPADEENSLTAAGYTLLSANLAYKLRNYVFSVYCENIFDISWNEAQFATETRLRDETGPDTDICYTPGNRRNFQIGLIYKF